MRLGDFISEALEEISRGVSEAKIKTDRTWIAPMHVQNPDGSLTPLQIGQHVEFDIAVEIDARGGGGISVFNLAELSGNSAKRTTNRLKFSVPIFLEAFDNISTGAS